LGKEPNKVWPYSYVSPSRGENQGYVVLWISLDAYSLFGNPKEIKNLSN